MFGIILLAYLCYRNGVLAKVKSENAFLWGGLTVIAYMVGSAIGVCVIISYFCKGLINLDQFTSMNPQASAQQLDNIFNEHPLHYVTMVLFGVGGYLLVRYLLERKPGKDKPKEAHWMDKLGE